MRASGEAVCSRCQLYAMNRAIGEQFPLILALPAGSGRAMRYEGFLSIAVRGDEISQYSLLV